MARNSNFHHRMPTTRSGASSTGRTLRSGRVTRSTTSSTRKRRTTTTRRTTRARPRTRGPCSTAGRSLVMCRWKK